MPDRSIANFVDTVQNFYTLHGRHDLPWRLNTTPYAILVSEVMLQQTQVDRVVPKFEAFLKDFPDFAALAMADQADVLRHWQGLGYNRRALALQRAARGVEEDYTGRLPQTEAALRTLPGIGPYTAAAIMSFAFDQPTVMIETNIRRVHIHHFFTDQEQVLDEQLHPFILAALETAQKTGVQPRQWYWSLMDYGASLAKTGPNPNRRSKHYTKQSRFEGSLRQFRGVVVCNLLERSLSQQEILTLSTIHTPDQQLAVLESLTKEGFIKKVGTKYQLV